MKEFSLIVICLFSIFHLTAQSEVQEKKVNKIFELKVDSIIRKITINKKWIDSTFHLLYTVKNISNDTLKYITNSCFYYNHYSLKTDQQIFDINPKGGCFINATTEHLIAPGETFNESEWITATNLNSIQNGRIDLTLSIPLILIQENTYKVDGREFVENEAYLKFNGVTEVIEKKITTGEKRKEKTPNIIYKT